MMQLFYVGIKGVIVKDGKILLLKRKRKLDNTYFWDLPGGRIDEGEEIEQTLRREMKEEIGLTKFEIGEQLYVYRLPRLIDPEKEASLFIVYYEIKPHEDVEVILSKEHEEYIWVDKAGLKALDFSVDLEAPIPILLDKLS